MKSFCGGPGGSFYKKSPLAVGDKKSYDRARQQGREDEKKRGNGEEKKTSQKEKGPVKITVNRNQSDQMKC
jgi:hypothetical protein